MTDEAARRRAELAALIETGWTNTPFSRCSFCGKDWNDGVGHEHSQGEMDPDPPYGFILVHEDKGGTIKFDAGKTADAVLAYVTDTAAQAVHEYRTKARGSVAAGVECDLCEEVVTEWEWVDKGWSLACRPCLDKIRAQAKEQCAKVADGWANSKSCTHHDDNPCCHVRTGAGIAEAIRRKPDDSATRIARQQAEAQPPPGPLGDHALQFLPGREPAP